MRVALITANVGNHCSPRTICPQAFDGELVVIKYTDENFPLRASMTPRAQGKIPKMLGWQMHPGFDYYIWMDASFSITRDNSIQWLVSQCKGYHACFYRHTQRNFVREERQFLEDEIKKGNKYIIERYANELYNDEWFKEDLPLLAAGLFIYTGAMFAPLYEWYCETMRYNINDQLSLPYILKSNYCSFNVIQENILHNKRFVHSNEKPVVLLP